MARPGGTLLRVGGRARLLVIGSVVLAGLGAQASGAAPTTPPAFPTAAWATPIGPSHLSSPVIADVNGDGRPEVVTADLGGTVHVLDRRTGRDLPGWPRAVRVVPGPAVAMESSPTVVDIDRDGRKEIVVGAGSIEAPGQQGGLVVFRADGTVRWRLKTMTVAGQSGVVGTPAFGDVNGDGWGEIVFGSYDHRLYVVDRNGRALPGFPIDTLDTIWDSPALFDVGKIGRKDIFLGGDASPGGPCGAWSWAGWLRRIRVTRMGPLVLWTRCQHQIFQSSPAIGDIGNDGRFEVVVGTGVGPSGDASASNTVKAFRVEDGSPIPGWPVLLNGPIFGSPVIGDVNGDRRNDVVVAACAKCAKGRVWAIGPGGRVLWSVEPGAPEGYHVELLSTPILVDLDGNGVNDVAVGGTGEFNFLRGADGARLYRPIERNRIIQNSAAVANFGAGVGWRLVVQSWKATDGRPINGTATVSSFPLPRVPGVKPAWPQWRKNGHHTGGPYPVIGVNGL